MGRVAEPKTPAEGACFQRGSAVLVSNRQKKDRPCLSYLPCRGQVLSCCASIPLRSVRFLAPVLPCHAFHVLSARQANAGWANPLDQFTTDLTKSLHLGYRRMPHDCELELVQTSDTPLEPLPAPPVFFLCGQGLFLRSAASVAAREWTTPKKACQVSTYRTKNRSKR